MPVGEAGTIFFEAADADAPSFEYYNDPQKHPRAGIRFTRIGQRWAMSAGLMMKGFYT